MSTRTASTTRTTRTASTASTASMLTAATLILLVGCEASPSSQDLQEALNRQMYRELPQPDPHTVWQTNSRTLLQHCEASAAGGYACVWHGPQGVRQGSLVHAAGGWNILPN